MTKLARFYMRAAGIAELPVATLRPVIKGAVAAAGAADGAGRESLLANNDMPSITSGTSICAQAALLVANNIVPSAADVKYVAVRFIAFLLIDLVLQKFEMQQAIVINLRVRLSLLGPDHFCLWLDGIRGANVQKN